MTDSVSTIDVSGAPREPEPPAPVFAGRIGRLGGSVVREILEAAASPDVISFAGGLPAPETIPELGGLEIPARYGQYGLTEGEPELRAAISRHLSRTGLECPPERIL